MITCKVRSLSTVARALFTSRSSPSSLRIVVVRHIQRVWSSLQIWFVRWKPIRGSVWNVRHARNVVTQRMTPNCSSVTTAIGKYLRRQVASDLAYFILLFPVVITCTVVLRLSRKPPMVIGVVNFAALSSANCHLDLFLLSSFLSFCSSMVCSISLQCCTSVHLFVLSVGFSTFIQWSSPLDV